MRILLPPSEGKRSEGDGPPLNLEALSFPSLDARRRAVLEALTALAADPEAARAALKLGPKSFGELQHDLVLFTAPTRVAMDRYSGVLYDALDAPGLDPEAREFARGRLLIHSAAFGLVDAWDAIPAYRLSHDSVLPGIRLRAHWSQAIGVELDGLDGLVLDLRSEGYVALGPASDAFFLRVEAEGAGGVRRALNHFNKKAKGELTRALLTARLDHPDAAALLSWATGAGFRLEQSGERELTLVTEERV